MTATTNLKQLKLNIVTQQQYDSMTKNANELYAVTDATVNYNDLSNKPTDFTGADGTNAGTSGFVPAPTATDNDKFLKGDGTWSTAGSSLPSQSGNSGKFLTTDGTDANWEDVPIKITRKGTLGYESVFINSGSGAETKSSCIVIGQYAGVGGSGFNIGSSIVIGNSASGTTGGVAIGDHATTGNPAYTQMRGNIAIGAYASIDGTTTKQAIQIGTIRTDQPTYNSDSNTMKVANANGNFEIMSADGTIPEARLADTTSAAQGQVLTLDSNLNAIWTTPSSGGSSSTTVTLAVNDWSSNTQTVSATGVTASNNVIIAAAPSSQTDYTNAGILCTAQGAGTLTFTCTTVPSSAITVNVLIFN